jgi:hypothetical protein
VRASIWPTAADVTDMVSIMGIVTRPELVAEVPMTDCTNSGM